MASRTTTVIVFFVPLTMTVKDQLLQAHSQWQLAEWKQFQLNIPLMLAMITTSVNNNRKDLNVTIGNDRHWATSIENDVFYFLWAMKRWILLKMNVKVSPFSIVTMTSMMLVLTKNTEIIWEKKDDMSCHRHEEVHQVLVCLVVTLGGKVDYNNERSEYWHFY